MIKTPAKPRKPARNDRKPDAQHQNSTKNYIKMILTPEKIQTDPQQKT
jgi:hypothetical protein